MTGCYVINEKAAVVIYARELKYLFSLRMPDYTPIFHAEIIAMILGLRKIPVTFEKVIILYDSRVVCDSLEKGGIPSA